MVSTRLVFLISSQILKPAVGLQVTPNSECAKLCIDDSAADVSDSNSSTTNATDIVCTDEAYNNTSAGQKFMSCLNCLQNSTANTTNENDQEWFLYNIRYAFSTCLYNSDLASEQFSTPCSISSVCGPLSTNLQEDLTYPAVSSQYSYCGPNNETFGTTYFSACSDCLRQNSDQTILANQLIALDAGCIQQPSSNTLLGLDGSVFSSSLINITNPILLVTSAKEKSLSTGAICGIAVGGVVLLALITAVLFICHRKRRNRKSVRSSLDQRYGNKDISNPVFGAFSHYNEPGPQTPHTPGSYEDVSLIKVPPPIKTSPSYTKYDLPKYDGHYPSPPLPTLPPALRQTHEEMARDLGFSMGEQHAKSPPVETKVVPMLYQHSVSRSHANDSSSDVSIRSLEAGPEALDMTAVSPIVSSTLTRSAKTSPVPGNTRFSPTIATYTSAPGLPSLPKRSPSFSHQYLASSSVALPRSHRRTTQDLSSSRGGSGQAPSNSPGQISGPIVNVGTRYEDEEKDARRRRERLYQEGDGKRKQEGQAERKIYNDDAQDLW